MFKLAAHVQDNFLFCYCVMVVVHTFFTFCCCCELFLRGEGWENISTSSLEKAKTQTLRFVAAPRHVRVVDVRF